VVDGVPVTFAPRVARDVLRQRGRVAAICLLDQGLRHGSLTCEDLAAIAVTVPRLRGSWADLADGRSESPLETMVRLVLRDAGLFAEPQIEVLYPDKRLAGRIDLGWSRCGRSEWSVTG
jgi:hypothetical protein